MSALAHVGYPRKRAWLGLLISGLIFLFVAAAVGLVVVTSATFAWAVIHGIDQGQEVPPFRRWLIGIPVEAWFMTCLCSVAFLSALIASRSRWIYRPALSAPLALAVFLTVLESPAIGDTLRLIFAGTRSPLSILVTSLWLYAPVASAALGGRFGERWFVVK